MKLSDIYLNYKTDKGNGHNYIDTYENLFSSIRESKLNVLEIGVLLGGSLKMWEHYFENSMIYGVDDFSQLDTNENFGGEPVNVERLKNELKNHERIAFIECNSVNSEQVKNKIGKLNLEFDIIIDDGDHTVYSQIQTFENFLPYLSENGIYVIEDCGGINASQQIKNYILDKYDGLNVEVVVLDIEKRSDDILVIIS